MKSLFLTFLLFSAALLSAQNVRVDGVVQSRSGAPAPGATVAVCSQPANTSIVPCAPLAPLCSSLTDTVCASPNPTTADGLGNYFFYIAPGLYSYQFYGNGLTTRVLPDQQVGSGSTPTSGTTASLSISPTNVDCGSVQVNTTVACGTVTLTNTGPFAVTVTAITFTPSQFTPNLSSCSQALTPGGQCSFVVQATPSVAGALTGSVTVTSTAPVDPQNPLTVALTVTGTVTPTALIGFSGFGAGSGTISDGTNNYSFNNGVCLTACTVNYPIGTVVTFTATPNSGSVFSGFSGAGITTSPGTFTVSQNQTITVTFSLQQASVSLGLVGAGQGSGSVLSDLTVQNGNGVLNCVMAAGVASSGGTSGCNGSFLQGSVATLTEAPAAGSQFVSWVGAPNCSTATTCAVTLNTNTTVVANFSTTSATAQIALTQISTNCSVSGSTIACNWLSPVLAGDLFMCAGAWPDNTTTVSSIADTSGNTYTQVPTISPKTTTSLSQVLYYAQNIAAANAGANTTTMTLSSSAASSISGTALGVGQSLSGATTIATPSITLGNNQLILASIWDNQPSGNGAAAPSSISGCGLTWVQIGAGVSYGTTEGTGHSGFSSLWRTLGNGASCVVTATWGSTQTARGITVSEFSGVDTSGSNGSGAIGISATNFGHNTNPSVTMGTFGSASNGTFGMTTSINGLTTAAGSGMALLNTQGHGSDEWAAGNVATVGFSYSGGTTDWGAIAIEIKASGSSGRRDMRCLEYAGVLQSGSPIDVSAAAVGNSAAPSSGGVTTGTANDLVTGFTASLTSVNTVSTGYTQRVKNSFGDDGEDQEGVPIATYPFAPALTSSGRWIASQVAWLAQSTSAPTVFSLSLNAAGTGNGGVTSNAGTPIINAGINAGNCFGVCSSSVPSSSSVILTATPSVGSAFIGWSGVTGCSTSAVCIVPNITSNQVVTATFNLSGTLNYYVANGGNDSRTATQAQNQATPWATVTHADAAMTCGAGGTTIHVANGTYGNVSITQGCSSSTARLVIQCDNGTANSAAAQGKCLFTGSGTAWSLNNGSNFDITGFDIGGNANQFDAIVGIPCGAGPHSTCLDSVHIIGNYIHDLAANVALDSGGCPVLGSAPGAILFLNHHNWFVNDAQFIGNAILRYGPASNPSCNTGPNGLYIDTQGAIIYNNLIVKVYNFGIQLYGQNCNARISNNTIITNNAAMTVSGGGEGICTQGVNTIDNNYFGNSVASHGKIFQISSLPCTDAAHQAFWGSNISDGVGADFTNSPAASCNTITPNGGTNIFTHATGANMFVNYALDGTGNYQLKSGSPGINGGTSQCVSGGASPCVPNFDILNVTRPQRATFDVGAYELP